jgi:putative holliday junction resolvase
VEGAAISGALIAQGAAEFRGALPHGGVLIGLDVGTHTIGTAFCDAGWNFASPAELIRRSKFARDKITLGAQIATRETKGIVIGLPINMDGSESPRSQSSRAFARNIADFGLPILLWDERWSTVAAERAMIEADLSRAKRAGRIDNAAAAHILQGAIDALTGSISVTKV